MKIANCLSTAVLTLALAAAVVAPAQAGIPVIDASNVVQTTISAIESKYQSIVQDSQLLTQIDQYTRQGLQYAKQIEQYQNMLKNTAAPAFYIWDQAQTTINGLMNTVNTLEYYKSQLGGIDNYLGKYRDLNYYRSSPCYSKNGCSAAQMAALEQDRALASEAQKKSGDSLYRVIEQQQTSLRNDAEQLRQLQNAAQSADGQMKALSVANQIASQQANQLLQLRSLVLAEQSAVLAKLRADADQEAQREAARRVMTESRYAPTPQPTNWLNVFGTK